MRALPLVLVAALAAFGLSACSLPQVGAVAVGVDASGGPVLVMASCEGPADTIHVSSEPEPDASSTAPIERLTTADVSRDELELTNPDPSNDDPAAVSLTDPGDPWTGEGAAFVEGRVYAARAWPTTEANLGSIDFTTAELAELGDGEVLYYDRGLKRSGPVADFIDAGLRYC